MQANAVAFLCFIPWGHFCKIRIAIEVPPHPSLRRTVYSSATDMSHISLLEARVQLWLWYGSLPRLPLVSSGKNVTDGAGVLSCHCSLLCGQTGSCWCTPDPTAVPRLTRFYINHRMWIRLTKERFHPHAVFSRDWRYMKRSSEWKSYERKENRISGGGGNAEYGKLNRDWKELSHVSQNVLNVFMQFMSWWQSMAWDGWCNLWQGWTADCK